ncbi:major capsid protein [Microvirus mar9]|uniref:Major capsid protein n=1 Tax=Microvirus mar9 TaxID=2851205 RepID=A0A8F5RBX0_9VIRU|nr:major capsid protein [Microvirus mar9]
MSNFSFSQSPVIRHGRSRFDLSHPIKTSLNVGELVPFDVQEIYPGDTFKVKTEFVSRLASQFVRPVVDNLFMDIYHFFVPSRLLYDKFPNVFGENTESAWANTQEYEVPTIPKGSIVPEKSVGDYLGLPTKQPLGANVSILPFRAFAKVYEDWFRDQNNINPMHIQKGELASSETFNDNAWAPNNYMGKLPKVAKLHDYFTSCLPAPQKGSSVDLPLSGNAPVNVTVPTTDIMAYASGTHDMGSPLKIGSSGSFNNVRGLYLRGEGLQGEASVLASTGAASVPGGSGIQLQWSNLQTAPVNASGIADLSDASAATVNDLRFAFQLQKMLERDARSGTRFVEFIQSHFGVSAGDYRLQRSEFLGGKRTPISIHQVTQTTGSADANAPLGQVGAFSLSGGRSRYTKGFTEHGFVISVCCIRQFHTYQQGIERFWLRSKRTQFYDPVFAHIGEQPVYKVELYGSADENSVFGYNEAWADLRRRQAKVTSEMRSNATNSYDMWHFADEYSNAPVLSEDFINETADFVDRTIVVPHTSADQFLIDFYVNALAYRVMPTYSVPSLIDHD